MDLLVSHKCNPIPTWGPAGHPEHFGKDTTRICAVCINEPEPGGVGLQFDLYAVAGCAVVDNFLCRPVVEPYNLSAGMREGFTERPIWDTSSAIEIDR